VSDAPSASHLAVAPSRAAREHDAAARYDLGAPISADGSTKRDGSWTLVASVRARSFATLVPLVGVAALASSFVVGLGCGFDVSGAGQDVPLGDAISGGDATFDVARDGDARDAHDGDALDVLDGTDGIDGDACGTAPCESGDPCKDAVLTCDGGVPKCTVVGPRPNGTPCGVSEVCNEGACVACPADTSCTPSDPCKIGKIDCSSGGPVCQPVDTVPDGEACGTGRSCAAGVCACDAGTTDCGGTCVDLASSSLDCGKCGSACVLSCVKSTCQSYLGSYEVACTGSPCPPVTCTAANDRTGACSCPTGAAGWGTDQLETEHPVTAIGICRAPTLAADADFGGTYMLKDYAAGCMAPNPAGGLMPLPASGCDIVNPYTGACSCPSGFVASSMRVISYCFDGTARTLGGWVIFCWSPTAPAVSFGGTFEVRDDSSCAFGNPATGACTCPSGATAHGYRVYLDVPSLSGATIYVCDR